jgi:hypothetical protein
LVDVVGEAESVEEDADEVDAEEDDVEGALQ